MTKEQNLRDMLHHIKSKEYLLENNPEKFNEEQQYAKENIYDAVKDNIEFFMKSHLPQNFKVNIEIPASSFGRMTLDELLEIKERFNKTVTGVFGQYYDNSSGMYLIDIYGKQFVMSCWKHVVGGKKSYELTVWDFQGVNQLIKIATKEPKLTHEQCSELSKVNGRYLELLDKQEQKKNRVKQIRELKEFITVKKRSSGYASFTAEVWVKNDIPITLTNQEIAEYADGFNHNFGWSCSECGTDESGEWNRYRVKINTD